MYKNYFSNGKLLLTGEYAVLDGALALAIPTHYGQSMRVKEIGLPKLIWRALDEKGKIWFKTELFIKDLKQASKNGDNSLEGTLKKIISVTKGLNPKFLMDASGFEIETKLDFPKDWGLGSSSTLINNIAQWTGVDAYQLLWRTFSGSGYDIACAKHHTPILYQLQNREPIVEEINFNPSFKQNLFFIYLNQKQNSRQGIARYRSRNFDTLKLVQDISEITEKLAVSKNLPQFEEQIEKHEDLLSKVLDMPTMKQQRFPDFQGSIKSLGAWGGDFILATGGKDTPKYFLSKGYEIVVPYPKMVATS